jgi:PAS domain S-box-containing protein
MSEQTAGTLSQRTPTEFRRSLALTVIISLVIIALLPAAIIGTTSYFRYRSLLETQLNTQLSSLAKLNDQQISQLISGNQLSLQNLTTADEVTSAFAEYPTDSNVFRSDNRFNYFLTTTIDTLSSNGIVGIYGLDPKGKVIFASDLTRIGQSLNTDPWLSSLLGTSSSTLAVNPGKLFPNQMILVTSYTKKMTGISEPITFFFFSKSSLFTTLMQNPLSYYPDANVFFITSDKHVVVYNPSMLANQTLSFTAAQIAQLNGYVAQSGDGKVFTYNNYQNQAVYAYIKPVSRISSSFIIEIPLKSATGQLQTFLSFIYVALAITLLLAVPIAFLGSRQIATPLVDLSNKARKFATGDFSQKANVNRRDEIGLLASSFNYMVNQLSTFYTSLEARVAERTEQLRTASEIAMEAISAPTTHAVLQRVTESIVNRLGYPYAAIYLADRSKKNLVLTEDHSNTDDILPDRDLRLTADASSLVGWVAANRQARLSQNVQAERPKLLDAPLLASTRSEIALPILLGERLIGVLDIQSQDQSAFDFESMPAFTTLTNQISVGLRNIEQLESNEVSLQENAFIYSATDTISNAEEEEDVHREIMNLFNQLEYVSFLFDVQGNEIRLATIGDANTTSQDQSLIGTVFPFENGLKELAENGAVMLEEQQARADFSNINAYLSRRACHHSIVIPVYEGKQLLHVMAIGSHEEDAFTALQMQPYDNLAKTIGASLEKIHLSHSLTQKEAEINFLSSTFIEANTETTSQQTYSLMHEQIRSAFGTGLGFCVAVKNEPSEGTTAPSLTISYYAVESPIKINPYPLSNDLLSQIVTSGESILLEDAAAVNKFTINSFDTHLTAKAWLGLPLVFGNTIVGAIAIFDPTAANVFTQETQHILELLASRIGLDIYIRAQADHLLALQHNYEVEKNLFDSLLINIPDRISFKNNNNEFIRLSKAMAEFLGEPDPQNLLGKADDFQYLAQTSESDPAEYSEAISTQTPVLSHTEKWTNREGEESWVIANRIPMATAEGAVSGLLSISSDITKYVKIEQIANRRAEQLLTAAEIANESTSGTMDIDDTLSRVVNLIKSRFNFYHASIFLIDKLGKNAILRESTGEAGAQLKQAGHKLSVGSASIVGQATGKGIPVVIGDITQEANYFANPLLPETRSEMAIPMKIGERVLGALDVQSIEYNAFSQEDINILQILANQTAAAVQNEDLFIHTVESLSRHRLLHQVTSGNVEGMTVEDAIRGTLEVLHQAMPDEQISYYTIDQQNVLTTRATSGITNPDQTSRRIPFGRGVVGRVASEMEAIRVDDAQSNQSYQPQNFETNSILAVPIKFADSLLGVLNIESTQLANFDENDLEFVTTLAGNMGSIISNITLLEQIREQVSRQQQLIEITSKIRRSVDIETIMQTSVSEIGNALNVRRATIQISPQFEKEFKKEQGQ